ncbi:hypothetical protein DSO57_1025363 [Entomophthora muscae]|uniref:Uncharacterized protein n=1 Tax=Entomophthora muscae TaxID=34485 RepID=A0ACC2TDF3_9FUNG|nr:hypothetical protein DSO57_1025363 [Entomophthora muscae]
MEDIKKLVAYLVAKQPAVAEENKTTTKGLIEKATDVNKQQKPVEQTKKKPQILLRKLVASVTKKEKEKEKPSDQQDSTEEALQSIQKEMLAFKKLIDRRKSKKRTEALNPSTVKPIPEDTNMRYTVPMDFNSNIIRLGSSWKELFEAFKAEFPDAKTPIPLLHCMDNTALLAEQQSYKVELD